MTRRLRTPWPGFLLFVVALACGTDCGGSPSGPTTPPASTPPAPAPAPAPTPTPEPTPTPPPPAPTPRVFATGRVFDAHSGSAQAGMQVSIDGVGMGVTNGSGEFSIEAPASYQDTTTIAVQGPNTVTRTTRIRIPGPPAVLSTMPTGIDVTAFDQMYRHSGGLTRWVEAPRLVVQTRVLQYTSSGAGTYTATNEIMTDAQALDIAAAMVTALPILTGGRFTAFARLTPEFADPGTSVTMMRTGDIVVAHFRGLLAASGSIGLGNWSTDGRFAVRGGYVMLDRTYDISDTRGYATRAHELGHALGYGHVSSRQQSVMNTPNAVDPSGWDRDSSRVAFQREPGNRSPDNDSGSFLSNPGLGGRIIWHDPVP